MGWKSIAETSQTCPGLYLWNSGLPAGAQASSSLQDIVVDFAEIFAASTKKFSNIIHPEPCRAPHSSSCSAGHAG